MNGEQHCDEQAGAEATGGPHQQKKKQERIHGMQQDAGEMMPDGIQAIQRNV